MIHPAIAFILLALLVALCSVGLWHQEFDDNLGQCFGMVAVILWAAAAIAQTYALHYMTPENGLLCVGLLSYGGGVAVRTYLYKRKRPRHEFDR